MHKKTNSKKIVAK